MAHETAGCPAPSSQTGNAHWAGDYLLTQREAAAFIRRTARTLQRMRREGGGPDWVEVNKRPHYWHSALIAYIARCTHDGNEPYFRPPHALRKRVDNTPPKLGGSKRRNTSSATRRTER